MSALSEGKMYKLILLSMFLTAGIVLNFIESVYLPPLAIPGAKLGIASLITLIMLIFFEPLEIIAVALLRVVIVGIVTGLIFTPAIVFSFSATLISTLLMLAVYRFLYGFFSFAGISIIGAVSHNFVQVLIAVPLLATNAVLIHLPLLIIVGCFTGVINGVLANLIAARKDVRYMVMSRLS